MGEQERSPHAAGDAPAQAIALTRGENAMLKTTGGIGVVAGIETIGLFLQGKPLFALAGAAVVVSSGVLSGRIRGA